ncbi:hypothetical protein TraAM80_07303 [Trypanosoma rangeli]|uniref:Uncharacterized protein n=1 Tax=Trypanosoma rangeli TaxID=5698 RepID=A0A422N6A0_TRYRA|nr:uncharacterized protein TraAM80_07303 [Trypanosoma rangeli]RNF00966.1 hypothetical protein TraAM80_07303 [Trypanosoma rangeli]|eukprot:RNF00966.1 hypothetical protein TraAM80_07303 [Trypanosoma rangeli]
MKPVAVGTLPADLIDAIRGGAVTLKQMHDNTIVFQDEKVSVEWHCTLQPGELHSYRQQKTGVSESAEVSRIAAVQKTTVQPEKKQSAPDTSATEDTSAPYFPSVSKATATLSDVMHQHRSLTMKIAYLLAPAPMDQRELLRSFAAENEDVLNDVLSVLTVLNRRGQRELVEAGYELIDIEYYSSKAVKQQVANLALPKVAHNKAVLDRFALYADRDVMLATCSRGIMAGLGSSKRKRDEDDDSEGVESDEGTVGQRAEEPVQKFAMTLLTSMDQSGIRWADGDLTKGRCVLSSVTKEVLKRRQRPNTVLGFGEQQALRPMPIVDASQLVSAQGDYAILRKEYNDMYDTLKRVEEVTEEARGWCQSNANRISAELREEIQRWFAAQEHPWTVLVTSFNSLHKVLYQLKREIEDYVNLREWGVLS